MYKVEVVNECSCFIKSGISPIEEFKSEEEAEQYAKEIIAQMNLHSCKKHSCRLEKFFKTFKVIINR